MPTKRERPAEFYRRLSATPPARNRLEALMQIHMILTQVEDELSGIPRDPNPPLKATDRLYPPKLEGMQEVPGRPAVRILRSFRHITFIGDNGAIEIKRLDGIVEFTKAGADGRSLNHL